MELPYNLIHQLENQFGSLTHVPESNLILKKLHISAKPHFKYKVTVSKTGQLIYSGNYRNYGMLMHHGCDCFEYTRRYLNNEGYHLERLPELMPWRKLENGDQYISHRRIITKGLD